MKAAGQYGLTGYPLGHSFSQKFFGELFARDHSGRSYGNFPIQELNERSFSKLLEDNPGLTGLNVTAPHKIAVMACLDEVDDLARRTGAVNTVRIFRDSEGKVLHTKGYNTDVPGLMKALSPLLRPDTLRALILGTGGASRAAMEACRILGIEAKTVSRTVGRGDITYDGLNSDIMESTGLIINATPLGTYPDCNRGAPIPYRKLTPRHICFDMVYNPAETLFMRLAAEMGATVENGLSMLHAQALESLKIWESDN